MARIFFSYSHDDESHRDQLEKHLSALQHEGLIESWHDRRLLAGSYLDDGIDKQLETADVVLLLVSASFLASNYCYGIEMRRALERHAQDSCKVIPVIVRACEWTKTPLGKLLAVPKDGKPVTLWSNYDEAMTDVARQIRRVLESAPLASVARPQASLEQAMLAPTAAPARNLPRSSNLRVRNEFTDADKDSFLRETFDFLADFFAGSLQELQQRHPAIEGRFRRVDGNTFTAVVYRNGKKASECAIRVGGPFGNQCISLSHDAGDRRGNSANDMLHLDNDDLTLFWKSGMQHIGGAGDAKMTMEQAAEHYWTALMRSLQ